MPEGYNSSQVKMWEKEQEDIPYKIFPMSFIQIIVGYNNSSWFCSIETRASQHLIFIIEFITWDIKRHGKNISKKSKLNLLRMAFWRQYNHYWVIKAQRVLYGCKIIVSKFFKLVQLFSNRHHLIELLMRFNFLGRSLKTDMMSPCYRRWKIGAIVVFFSAKCLNASKIISKGYKVFFFYSQ